MCISMGPGTVFSGVVTAGFQLSQDVHALAYMNHATPDRWVRRNRHSANCMLLHVPGSLRDLVPSQDNGDFLKEMGRTVPSLVPERRMRGGTLGGWEPDAATRGFVIEQYGAYEVILADSAEVIPDALEEISPQKRPVVNDSLTEWYGGNFPDCAFVLACFNNDIEVADHPIVLRYQPHNPELLFAPGLESHTGEPPTLGAHDGSRDFKVVFGSLLASKEAGHDWRPYRHPSYNSSMRRGGFIEEPKPASYGPLDAILPDRIVGFYDKFSGANEDYVATVEDVLAGTTGLDLFQTMPSHFQGSHLDASFVD